jgi:hypothetical protein
MANPKMVGEVPFAKIRTVVRKMMKPMIKEMIKKYHTQKLAAFKAQRECFVRLMKVEATMQCAAYTVKTSQFLSTVGNKTMIKVREGTLKNMTKICMQSVRW